MSDQSYGISVLYEPRSGTPEFDIVAIHGLGGHPIKTWTHSQTGVMWLQDLLPDELPNARIMTFGYDARFHHFTGNEDLTRIALDLLTALEQERTKENEKKRKTIFLCHSLGGCIAKRALLVRAKTSRQAFAQKSVFGVLFLATPHNTLDPATTAEVLARIAASCSWVDTAWFTLPVRSKSRALYEISTQFNREKPDLKFLSFYETQETSLGFLKRLVIVDKGTAILGHPGEEAIQLEANHTEIARMSGKNDKNFTNIAASLAKWCKKAITGVEEPTQAKEAPEAKEVKNATETMETKSLDPPRAVSTDTLVDEYAFYETPFKPCETFKGREDLLESMDNFFEEGAMQRQRTFVLAGLGGCGKTHTALQYAHRRRFRYKHGVFFFNASSKETVAANFDRILNMLSLPAAAKNKEDVLKRWLCKPGNSDWLLIFDNADDLATHPIDSYIPRSGHGHIIVTTRDQAAIGSVSEDGASMQPLEDEDAMEVLLAKAKITAPSADDIEQSRAIVQLLGGLPLAVEQAGAYIRSQQKPLREYRQLAEERVGEVLKQSPGISARENSYLSAWELNFRQLEKESTIAASFLLLLSFLESTDIPESMLRRGSSNKKIWNTDGEVAELSPKDAGLRADITTLIQDQPKLDRVIEKLLAFSLITPNSTPGRGRVFSIHPLVQYSATQRVPMVQQQRWQKQAVLLICQAFPFSTYVDQRFGDKGREMLPHVPRILKEYDQLAAKERFTAANKRNVSIMLLSAIKFGDSVWKREKIVRAKELVLDDTDPFLRAWLATCESTFLRGQGNYDESMAALADHVKATILPGLAKDMESDARWNAQRGELTLSFAETLLRDGDRARAKAELAAWTPLNPSIPSSMEKMIMQSRDTLLARIYKDDGNFEESLPIFQRLMRETGYVHDLSTGWQLVMLNNLSANYCELGRPLDAEFVLAQQLKLVYERKWENLTVGRGLLQSLIEAYIRRGAFEEAKTELEKLIPVFEAIPNKDQLQRIGLARVWMGLARVAHMEKRWSSSFNYWSRAAAVQEEAGWTKTFTHAAILFSMAQVLYQLDQKEEAYATREAAEEAFSHEGRRYWIAGLGSYWMDYVFVPLGEFGPDPVVSQESVAIQTDVALKVDNMLALPDHSSDALTRARSKSSSGSELRSASVPLVEQLGKRASSHSRGGSADGGAITFTRRETHGMLSAAGKQITATEDAKADESRKWFQFYDEVETFLHEEEVPDWDDNEEPVKIAVLDTGADMKNKFLRANDDRIIECESFLDEGDPHDTDGHGTDVVGLVLRTAKNASIFVAKVADNRGSPDLRAIEDAINHAIDEWEVDVINMSFGFDTPHEPIRQALARAHAADILLFAAGHNDGANKALAFPASTANVIAVGATDSYGKDSNFTPLADKKAYYFSAFGVSPTGKSGTSFATPIAVGIAGVVIDYVNHLKNPEAWPPLGKTQEQKDADLAERIQVLNRIKTLDGMTAVLKMLSRGQDTYLAPWYLFKPGSPEVRHMVVHKLRNLSDTD